MIVHFFGYPSNAKDNLRLGRREVDNSQSTRHTTNTKNLY
jgi:hypothetical protein